MKRLGLGVFAFLLMTVSAWAKPMVAVSIPPEKFLIDEIGGGTWQCLVVVDKAQDPHVFEPTPRQLVELRKCEMYFRIGLPFEAVLVDKLLKTNPTLHVVRLSESEEHVHEAVGAGETHHDDPHSWMSPDELLLLVPAADPSTVCGIQRLAGLRPVGRFDAAAYPSATGVTATTRFGDMQGMRVLVVATDLSRGGLVIYGDDPHTRVMDAVIGSAAVPPWVAPVQHDDRILVDGGLVSNLPIQAALLSGASEIIALDLHDARILNQASNSIGNFLVRLLAINQHRLTELELELAAAKGVVVHHIPLLPTRAVAFWDFARTPALIETGYRVALSEMARWPASIAR